jgi:hypothetical protein
MKDSCGSGAMVDGFVKVQLLDKYGKIKQEEEGHNEVTEYGKYVLKYWNLLSESAQSPASGGSMTASSPLSTSGAVAKENNCSIEATFFTGGGHASCLHLLNNPSAGMSRYGEQPYWAANEITGFCFNSTISGAKRGAIVPNECQVAADYRKVVYSFPEGVATGTITHLVRGQQDTEWDKNSGDFGYFKNSTWQFNGVQNTPTKDSLSSGRVFYNQQTNAFYQIESTSSNTLKISAHRLVKYPGMLPIVVQESMPNINIPGLSSTLAYHYLWHCNDNFAILSTSTTGLQSYFYRVTFSTGQCSFLPVTSAQSGNNRTLVQRGYPFTAVSPESSVNNFDDLGRNTSTCCSYDGNYLYCFSTDVRNEEDTARVVGKIKVDTRTWKAIERKNGGIANRMSLGIMGYIHDPYNPEKLCILDRSVVDKLRSNEDETFENPYPCVMYGNFDPETLFKTNPIVRTNEDLISLYAKLLDNQNTPFIEPFYLVESSLNDLIFLADCTDGKKICYSQKGCSPVSRFFSDPFEALFYKWNIFSQFTLGSPINKGASETLRVEYTFRVSDSPIKVV